MKMWIDPPHQKLPEDHYRNHHSIDRLVEHYQRSDIDGTCIFINGKEFNMPWSSQVKNVDIERFLIHGEHHHTLNQ